MDWHAIDNTHDWIWKTIPTGGCETLKPFIHVMSYPMIYWVLKMFSKCNITSTLLILRSEHYNELPYVKLNLQRYAPHAKLCLLNECDESGPVPNILRAKDYIDDQKPVLVSYCDFYMHWNDRIIADVISSKSSDGIIPCYSGFHPHLIFSRNLYATCHVDNENNLLEIKEKFSFHQDRYLDKHSPGVYYLKSGSLLRYYYHEAVKNDLNTSGEYFCSLPYNLMVQDGLKVHAPVNVHNFCQWGTPEDLREFEYWFNLVKEQKSIGYKNDDLTYAYWLAFHTNENSNYKLI